MKFSIYVFFWSCHKRKSVVDTRGNNLSKYCEGYSVNGASAKLQYKRKYWEFSVPKIEIWNEKKIDYKYV